MVITTMPGCFCSYACRFSRRVGSHGVAGFIDGKPARVAARRVACAAAHAGSSGRVGNLASSKKSAVNCQPVGIAKAAV